MKVLFSIFFLTLVVFNCWALPARRTAVQVTQPDGTQVTVVLIGDEFFHYYTTLDGVALYKESDGSFSYAHIGDDGVFSSSNRLAHNVAQRNSEEVNYITTHNLGNIIEPMAVAARRNAGNEMRAKSRERAHIYNTIGTVKVPVLLVQFADNKYSLTKTVMNNHFNGVNYTGDYAGSYGSVRDYFLAQSDGQFVPEFEILGVVTLPKEMKYYGENDDTGYDKHPEEIVIDGCKLLDSEVDFSAYDNDGDGGVDFIYVIYAGYDESSGASENAIWAHQWTLSEAGQSPLILDGVQIDSYACSSELFLASGKQIDGIGTVCHEFSHCLGLPDFYDTSGNNYFGMDCWSIMDYGCFTFDGFCPNGYTAYEKESVGWMEIETLDSPCNITLEPLNNKGKAYRIINDANSNEYYVLENRQLTAWDKYLPNSGLLISHVDYSSYDWEENTVNTVKNHQRMTLMPADGELLSYYDASTLRAYTSSLKGDTWPGTMNNTALTNTTMPSAKVYTGGYMSKPITHIKEENGIVTLRFMGGFLEIPAVSTKELTTTGFGTEWEPVEGADDYTVMLYLHAGDTLQSAGIFETDSCSFIFEGLVENSTYSYCVRAENEYNASAYSDTVSVSLTPTKIATDNPIPSVLTVQDNVLQINGGNGALIEIYSLSGRLQKQFVCDSDIQELRLERGVYIVRVGEQTSKIQIR